MKHEFTSHNGYYSLVNYTLYLQKTSPSVISRSLVKRSPILVIFSRNIPEKIWLKMVFQFPPHLMVFLYYLEKQKRLNVTNIVPSFSCLIWSIKHQISIFSPQKIEFR